MDWNRFEYGWRRASLNPRAQVLVVLLHGAGGDAGDLLPLADSWSRALAGAAFTSLNGGQPFEGGAAGRQWFSRREIDESRRLQRVADAYPTLCRVLSAELARCGLDFDSLALVGFSQGAIMALYHVATNPAGAAAVVAYSSRLAAPVVAHSRTPLTLIHGTDDDVIPVLELERAAHAFSDEGYAVEAYALPGVGHSISIPGALLGRDALVRALVDRPQMLARSRRLEAGPRKPF